MQNYRFAFDLGTNSIGFSIFLLKKSSDGHYLIDKLIDAGVRLFPDGRNPKDNIPLAVNRRIARGARRRRDRLIQRKRVVVNLLKKNGLFPIDRLELEALKLMNPYTVRAEALTRPLTPYELGRALFHIGVRRGFKSNRIADSSANTQNDKELKGQALKMKALTEDIEASGSLTLGQFLYGRIQNHEGTRFRPDEFDAYPSREHYEREFNEIKAYQQKSHTAVDWDAIYEAIFFQRPLKEQERGRCTFYTDEFRAFTSQPSSHIFRIVSEVNNLKFSDEHGNVFTLSNGEKDALISQLQHAKTLKFSKIRKQLNIKGQFNLEDEKRDALKGNAIACDMRDDRFFAHLWDTFSLEKQDEIIEKLILAQTDDEVMDYLSQFPLSTAQKEAITRKSFPRKTGSLSTKFMRECTEIMQNEYIRYDEAVTRLDMHHSKKSNLTGFDRVPYYGQVLTDSVLGTHPEAEDSDVEYKYGKIANPTVHITLNQLRKVMNALIDRYGKPEEIVIELARDITLSAEGRSQENSRQAKQQKENDEIREILTSTFKIDRPSSWDIKKYKLWCELGKDEHTRRCPYTGKIIPAYKLFTEEIQIEHILPYSRTMLSSMSNLTLSYASSNQFKKEQSPYEAFASNPKGYNWEEILERAKTLPGIKMRRFLKNAMDDFEKAEAGFVERQINDTRFISRAAVRYLSSVCPANKIWSIKGNNTSELRAKWNLNTLLSSSTDIWYKNRNDQRHHALDAIVIGLTDRSLIQRMAQANVGRKPANKDVPQCPIPREEIKRILQDALPSYKPDHGHQGKLFKETATGARTLKSSVRTVELSQLTKSNIDSIVDNDLKAFLSQYMQRKKSLTQAINAAKELFDLNDTSPVQLGDKVWVTRTNLVSLSKEDLENERLLNKKLNAFLLTQTASVINDKKTLATTLSKLSRELKIKKVRIIPKNQVFEKIDSVENKWYEKDGICYVTIWAIPGKNKTTYEGQFVDYRTAYLLDSKKIGELPKPHPAAKRMMVLYKNDVIFASPHDGGQGYYARIAGYSTTRNQIDIQPIFCAKDIPAWLGNTNPILIKEIEKWENMNNAGNNFKSINVLFSDSMVRLCIITPDGKDKFARGTEL